MSAGGTFDAQLRHPPLMYPANACGPTLQTMSASLNPSHCPLCGQPNQCAVAAGLPAESCWCMQTQIAPQALERLPAEQRGQACICPTCGQVTVANGQPDEVHRGRLRSLRYLLSMG